jgi:hypothetical protein
MTLLAQSAYVGPLILEPVAVFDVWAAKNITTNPASVNSILGTRVPVIPSSSKRVSGYFQDQNSNPISRAGIVLDRATGVLLTSFISNASTGAFSAYVPNPTPVIIVLIPNLGDSRNAIILDDISPV